MSESGTAEAAGAAASPLCYTHTARFVVWPTDQHTQSLLPAATTHCAPAPRLPHGLPHFLSWSQHFSLLHAKRLFACHPSPPHVAPHGHRYGLPACHFHFHLPRTPAPKLLTLGLGRMHHQRPVTCAKPCYARHLPCAPKELGRGARQQATRGGRAGLISRVCACRCRCRCRPPLTYTYSCFRCPALPSPPAPMPSTRPCLACLASSTTCNTPASLLA